MLPTSAAPATAYAVLLLLRTQATTQARKRQRKQACQRASQPASQPPLAAHPPAHPPPARQPASQLATASQPAFRGQRTRAVAAVEPRSPEAGRRGRVGRGPGVFPAGPRPPAEDAWATEQPPPPHPGGREGGRPRAGGVRRHATGRACVYIYIYIYIHTYGRFPKFHSVFFGRDPGTLKRHTTRCETGQGGVRWRDTTRREATPRETLRYSTPLYTTL